MFGFEGGDVHAFGFLEDALFEFALALVGLQVEQIFGEVGVGAVVLRVVAFAKVVLVYDTHDVHLWVAHIITNYITLGDHSSLTLIIQVCINLQRIQKSLCCLTSEELSLARDVCYLDMTDISFWILL